MRGTSWWLSVAVLCALSACRLDLKGESLDEDDVEGRDPADRIAAAADGRKTEEGDDLASGSALSCAAASVLRAAREYTDDMKQLSGAIHVTGDALLRGGEVTIAPGTTFIFDADSSLDIGWNSTRTTLTALGTADKPIRFCSDQPGLGRWGGLRLSNGLTSDSVFQHAHVYDADGPALAVNAPVSVLDVTIHGSTGAGVVASDFGEDSARLTVTGAQGSALLLTGQAAVHKLPKNSVFEDNVDNTAHIRLREYNGGVVHLQNIGIPYVQDQDMIAYNVTLDFEAGIDYRFAADSGLDVGWNSGMATITVAGTAANPVVFSGVTEKPGSWMGINIGRNVSTDSVLSHTQFLYGGTGRAPFSVYAKITLEDILVADSATPPIIGVPLPATSKNFSVSGSAGVALVSNMVSLTGIPRGGSFIGNAKDMIEVPDQTPLDSLGVATIPNLGVPYYVTGDIEIGAGSDVTVEPGVEFVFKSGNPYHLLIGWNSTEVVFNALGTAAQPIIFRGEKDDVGTWNGLSIGRAVSTDSVFDHIQVRNAGMFTESQVTIQNSSFTMSPGFGIVKTATNTSDYSTTNTFTGNVMGDVGMF